MLFPGALIFWNHIIQIFVKINEVLLLQNTQKAWFYSFTVICRNLSDNHLFFFQHASFLMLCNIWCINTFPLKIFSDLGMQEHLNKFTVCHNEFWNQINVPVSIMTIFFWWINTWSKLSPKVGKIEWCSLGTIVLISINMQNLLTFSSQKSWENTFFQTCSANNHIIFLVHFIFSNQI